jgi:2,3-bisphosphoglycerate-independent phosphoglycerate mutase
MVLFGYDPDQIFHRSLAALKQPPKVLQLGPHDWAVRCNLVTIENQTMIDFTADHISTQEATELLEACQKAFGSEQWKFVPGVSYRNLLLYRGNEQTAAPFNEHTRSRAIRN